MLTFMWLLELVEENEKDNLNLKFIIVRLIEEFGCVRGLQWVEDVEHSGKSQMMLSQLMHLYTINADVIFLLRIM